MKNKVVVPINFSKPFTFYTGFLYDELWPQYVKTHPELEELDHWSGWEELWDEVLVITSSALVKQGCIIKNCRNVDPKTLELLSLEKMSDDLSLCWEVIAVPPEINLTIIFKHLSGVGLTGGVKFLKYIDEHDSLVTVASPSYL